MVGASSQSSQPNRTESDIAVLSRFSYRTIPLLVRWTSFQNPQKRAPRPLLLSHLRRASDQNSNYAVRKTRRAASLAWPGGGIHSDSCVPGRPWASNGSFLRLLDFPSVCPGLLRLPLWRLLASLLVLCLALWSAATSGADVRCLPRDPLGRTASHIQAPDTGPRAPHETGRL